MSQRTLILVKPDGVRRNIIGDVISRIERKGLKVIAMELRTIEVETARSHYAEHAERPFFGSGQGAARHHQGRLRPAGRAEHRARLGLARERRAGNQDLLPRARLTAVALDQYHY